MPASNEFTTCPELATPKKIQLQLDSARITTGLPPLPDPAIHSTTAYIKLRDGDYSWVPNLVDYARLQSEISMDLRANEVRWIWKMCDKYGCDPVCFPLAVSYFDRILCLKFVPAREIRLLAAVCLLLAAKLKMALPLKGGVLLTNLRDVTPGLLFDFEVQAAKILNWQFNTPTPYEYFDHLVAHFKFSPSLREKFSDALLQILVCEFAFAPPLMHATAALMAAESFDYGEHKDYKSADVYSQCLYAASPKYLVPGDTRFSCGDVANRPSSMGLHASSSMFSMDSRVHDVRVQREPRSYYQLLDMNRDPVDLTPRLANVPSQYHMRDMFEFGSLHSPTILQTP